MTLQWAAGAVLSLAGGALIAFATPLAALAADTARPSRDAVVFNNKWEDTIDIIDPGDGKRLGRVATGTHPHEIAVSHDGTTAYATIYGDGTYAKNPHPNDQIAVVDLRAQTESRISVAPYKGPHGIAVDPQGLLWVTSEVDAKLLVVDPRTKKVVAAIPTQSHGSHWVVLTPDGKKAYTSNKEDTFISVFDTAKRTMIGRVAVPRGTEGLGVSPDGKRLYAGDFREPYVNVVDTEKDVVLKTLALQLGGRPGRVRVCPRNKNVVVTSYLPGAIEVIDVATLTSRGVIKTGKAPMGVIFDPARPDVYITNTDEPSISVVDLEQLAVVRTIPTGKGPDGIAFARMK